MFNTVE